MDEEVVEPKVVEPAAVATVDQVGPAASSRSNFLDDS